MSVVQIYVKKKPMDYLMKGQGISIEIFISRANIGVKHNTPTYEYKARHVWIESRP